MENRLELSSFIVKIKGLTDSYGEKKGYETRGKEMTWSKEKPMLRLRVETMHASALAKPIPTIELVR